MKRVATRDRTIFTVLALTVLTPVLVLAFRLAVEIGPNLAANGDNAANELHVRDVGSHPVLLGPYSRDGWSHPGPAVYYVLAVGYRLAGDVTVGTYLAALAVNAGSIGVILAVSRARGGTSLLTILALAMAVLMHRSGAAFLADPWNPFVTVLPFGALIMCCWAAACETTWIVSVTVVLASWCVQTHIAYLPLVAPLLVWTAIAMAFRHRRTRSGPSWKPLLCALLIGSAMWLPPVIQQLTAPRGNASALLSYFRNPPEPAHSLNTAYDVVIGTMQSIPDWYRSHEWSLTALVPDPSDTPMPWLLLLFGVASLVAMRRDHSASRDLTGVLGATAVAAVFTIWRTTGPLIDYRLGWLPMLAMLLAGASVWIGWLWFRRSFAGLARAWVPFMGVAAFSCIALVSVQNIASARVLTLDRVNANGADVVPTLLSSGRRWLPRARGQVVVSAQGTVARIFLPASVLWLEERGYDARVEDEHARRTSLLLYDDSERTFGSHRVCSRSGPPIAAHLVLGLPALDRPPLGTGFRRVSHATYVPQVYPLRRAVDLYLRPGTDPVLHCTN